MLKIKQIYDNEGKTFDRYTVVLEAKSSNLKPWTSNENMEKVYLSLSLNHNPWSPQGFSQFSDVMIGDHLGKKIQLQDLPEHIQDHIAFRLK